MIERLDEPERKRRLLAALDRLDALNRLDANRRPVPPPFPHPLAPQVSTFALELRIAALEAVVRQLLEMPVVRHSGVVTATLEDGE